MADDLDFGDTSRGMVPGQVVFGRFVIKRLLGCGGMGIVWRAEDRELKDEVALKFLPPEVAADPAAVDELRRETRKSRTLTHPRIVRIHDFLRDAQTAAISMELVEGPTLTALRMDKPDRCFEVAEIATWVGQLCEGLAYAHEEARVVHRDLKPANLMLTAGGTLKIADFGIAASLSESVTRASRAVGTSGTPLYMSPQQMMGEAPAVSDDIYALGATLYELLTGKPPFYRGKVEMQVMNAVPVSLVERRVELGLVAGVGDPGIPAAWEETIAACLAKEARGRPQSAGEVWERLKGGKAEKLKGGKAESKTTERTEKPEEAAGSGKGVGVMVGLAGLTLVIALGWVFGVQLPKQRGLESERMAAELLPVEAVLEAVRRPRTGERFTVPDLGLELLPIAAGTFQMGSASGGGNDERPVTRVTLSRPFWLGETEVTQGQWEALMGSNPSSLKGLNLPVEQVSWSDAMDYLRKLTERERVAGRLPEGYAYTLPTEAQWEYAARAGTTGDYGGTGRLDDMGWYGSNSGNSPKPVGTKQANAWGLHDMHGNVWEWCADWYGTYPGGSVTDPRGSSSGSNRVNRGGGYFYEASYCRSAFRYNNSPGLRFSNLGFRLALSSSP